ncbi:hypothetical protein [Streptomyces sp. LN590]|uniref:hypothetical protein n=1 Tax=Streptomyces sp. LN590 TaxID=3112980 RepID=UPI00371A4B74
MLGWLETFGAHGDGPDTVRWSPRLARVCLRGGLGDEAPHGDRRVGDSTQDDVEECLDRAYRITGVRRERLLVLCAVDRRVPVEALAEQSVLVAEGAVEGAAAEASG